jgi:hypothetical protein
MKSNTLKLTRGELKKIIQQEIEAIAKENPQLLNDVNPFHSGKTGRFSTKDAEVYSLTKNAKDNVKNIPIGRGRNKGGKPVAKYGMNVGRKEIQCGRLAFDGSPKKKSRRCVDYKKSYWEPQKEDLDLTTGLPVSNQTAKKNKTPQERKDKLGVMPKELSRLSRGLMEAGGETWVAISTLERLLSPAQSLTEAQNPQLVAKCRAMGFRSFEDLLRAMDAMKRASDGKLLQADDR